MDQLKKQVFLQPISGSTLSIDHFVDDSIQEIFEELGIQHLEDVYLTYNGKILSRDDTMYHIPHGAILRMHTSLRGGKGGFGSLLRGQALAKRTTNNFDASKDL